MPRGACQHRLQPACMGVDARGAVQVASHCAYDLAEEAYASHPSIKLEALPATMSE